MAASAIIVALPTAGEAQSVNYAELEEMFGEPVTTSVTGSPQRASEAPAALVIITRDDIARSPAHDIPGLLQAYAGIDVARWTAGQADVSIRGGVQPFNPRLLVLVNGRQVYLDYFGMTNWAGLGVQLEEIQQIEIVRGPNGALFGFNAVAGVINIITIDPLQTRQIVTVVEAGTRGHVRASQSAALRLGDRVGLRLSGGFEESDELEGLGRSAFAPPASARLFGPRHYEAAAEIVARPREGTEFSLSATYSNARHLDVSYVLNTAPDFYEFFSVGARISHDTSWGTLSAQVFENRSDIHVLISPVVELNLHNKVLVASAGALVRAGTSNILRFGLEYRVNALRAPQSYPGSIGFEAYAASTMWEARFSNALTFTAAARVDHLGLRKTGIVDQPSLYTAADFDRSLTVLTLNGALLLKLDDTSSLRLSGGRGVQAPSLLALGTRLIFPIPGLGVPLLSEGNPSLAPSIIWSGEAGYMRTFGVDGPRLELTAFYNRTTDVIAFRGPGTRPVAAPPAYPFIAFRPENSGSFQAFGIEAALSGRIGPNLHWMLNYSWTRADQHIEGSSGSYYERPLALDVATPEHKIRAQLSYDRGPWLATIAARYTSETQQLTAPSGNRPLILVEVEDSLALDARLAFTLNDRVTLSVAGENLTNAAGADLSPAAAERRLRASVRLSF